jgi:hypothetical protein
MRRAKLGGRSLLVGGDTSRAGRGGAPGIDDPTPTLLDYSTALGDWADFSDISRAYQDSGLATAVTTDGDVYAAYVGNEGQFTWTSPAGREGIYDSSTGFTHPDTGIERYMTTNTIVLSNYNLGFTMFAVVDLGGASSQLAQHTRIIGAQGTDTTLFKISSNDTYNGSYGNGSTGGVGIPTGGDGRHLIVMRTQANTALCDVYIDGVDVATITKGAAFQWGSLINRITYSSASPGNPMATIGFGAINRQITNDEMTTIIEPWGDKLLAQ